MPKSNEFEKKVDRAVARARRLRRKRAVVSTKGYDRDQVLEVRATYGFDDRGAIEPGLNVQFRDDGGPNEALVITWK